jgi:hypothetical protein
MWMVELEWWDQTTEYFQCSRNAKTTILIGEYISTARSHQSTSSRLALCDFVSFLIFDAFKEIISSSKRVRRLLAKIGNLRILVGA